MKLLANKRDYKNGFRKHYIAYRFLKKDNDSVMSRCLLLVYSVECGLKFLLLDKWREESPKKVMDDDKDNRGRVISSHNIQKILKELGHSEYHFPAFMTSHGQMVNSENYHQFCRYGLNIRNQNNNKNYMEIYERLLVQVAEWIEKEI